MVKKLITIFCFLIWAQWVWSTDSVAIIEKSDFARMEVSAFTSLLIDKSGELTLDQVRRADTAFVSDWDTLPVFDYPTAYWLRLKIDAQVSIDSLWLIFTRPNGNYRYFTNNDFVDGYYIQEDILIAHHRSGGMVPRSQKSVSESRLVNVLPLDLDSQSEMTLYIRIQNVHVPSQVQLNVEITRPVFGVSNANNRWAVQIIGGFGAYLVVGIYVLFFFLVTKNPDHLYFGLFAVIFAFHRLWIEPQGNIMNDLFYDYPHLGEMVFICLGTANAFLFLFGRSFTQIKTRMPKWDIYLKVIIVLSLLMIVITFFRNLEPPYIDHSQVFFSVIFVALLPLCIKWILSPHIPSKIFAVGIFWFVSLNAAGIMWHTGIISLPFNPWSLGQHGLLLIYGLGLCYELLINERIKAQAEKIQELDAIKSRFFTNISHEFRTPLSLIIGPVTQSLESLPSSEIEASNEEIPIKTSNLLMMKRNARRLQNLVDQLLDLSKLESKKMKLHIIKGDILSFIRSQASSFNIIAQQKHINFTTVYGTGGKDALYDTDKLQKILNNLLSNAFKFTPEHGTVQLKADINASRLHLTIADSGPGIDDIELNQIFNRFYQVEGTESQGTGIGLALVKELVDLHGGQIAVDSAKNQGTSFTVSLPIVKEALPRDFEITDPIAMSSIDPSDMVMPEDIVINNKEEKAWILVAEDNPDLRNFIAQELSKTFNIILASDGEEAHDKALQRVPDLIVSDVMMPKMNGTELCARLKMNDITSHIPIILLTAKVGRKDKMKGLEGGADDYLTKPFDFHELKVRIANLLKLRASLRKKYQANPYHWANSMDLSSMDERFLKEVLDQIEKNMGNEFYTVEDLAGSVNFSRSQLNRKIKALTDKTTNQLIRDIRLARAKVLLEKEVSTISEIAYQVGYSNLSYFTKSFKNNYGILPSQVKVNQNHPS